MKSRLKLHCTIPLIGFLETSGSSFNCLEGLDFANLEDNNGLPDCIKESFVREALVAELGAVLGVQFRFTGVLIRFEVGCDSSIGVWNCEKRHNKKLFADLNCSRVFWRLDCEDGAMKGHNIGPALL